jgi:hypothetical protein
MLCVVGLLAVTVFGGCSSVEPSDRWDGHTGSVSGTLRSSEDAPVAGIEVWLWAELAPDGREVAYDTLTDEQGYFEFPAVQMATTHSFQQDYDICANRTPDSRTATDDRYSTFRTTITVERGSECVQDIVIEWQEPIPDDPEVYIDD